MKELGKLRSAFARTVLAMVLFSLSFLLMPLPFKAEGTFRKILLALNGVYFWLTLIASVVWFIKTARLASEMRRKLPGEKKKTLPGILRFFTNPAGVIADGVLIASALVFAVLLIKKPDGLMPWFGMMTLAALSISMHSMFNGSIYALSKNNLHREKTKHEKER